MALKTSGHSVWMMLTAAVLLTAGGCTDQFGKQPTEAELIAEQLEEQKELAVSLYVDALMLNEIDAHQDALKKLELATELNPQFALAYSMKGDIYQKQQDYPKSADAYERATELDPWSFKDFFNLGKVSEAMKEFARAVRAYANACKLDPGHYESHYKAARCYYELKEYEPSLEYANKAKTLNPSSGEVEALFGDVFEARKNHAEAIDSYRRALELKGNDPNIMVPLAVCYLRTGRFTAARELLTDVIAEDPQNGPAYQYIGYAQLKLKETDAAIESYKKSVQINDNDWMAHKGLGVAYMLLAIKNNDEKLKVLAVEQWTISLGLKPDQPELQALMEKHK